jgi:subtilisin-like proprotein convertase family protein
MMKKQIGILMLALSALVGHADTGSFTNYPGATVPDSNPVGLVDSLTISGMSGTISNLTVELNITGGFNGDLYAYLVSPTSGSVVLLNRTGISSSNAFGASQTGFNITLDANASNNIHDYLSAGYSLNGNGQVIGTWQPDQRTISPASAPSQFDLTPTGNNLSYLNNSDPNGVWTLFIADLSLGGQSTLVSWGLNVVTVPEPQTWTLLGGGLVGFFFLARKRRC